MDDTWRDNLVNRLHAQARERAKPARRSLQDSPIRSKQDMLRHSLEAFFADAEPRQAVVDILQHKSPLSLRVMDHLVTKYAVAANHGAGVVYPWTDPRDPQQHPRLVDLSAQYSAYLKGNPKVLFDPFCRGEKMLLCTDGQHPVIVDPPTTRPGVTTNIRQLNFFRWALEHGVVQYALDHLGAIEDHMNGPTSDADAGAVVAGSTDGRPSHKRKAAAAHLDDDNGGGGGSSNASTTRGKQARPAERERNKRTTAAPAAERTSSKQLKYVRGSFVVSFNVPPPSDPWAPT